MKILAVITVVIALTAVGVLVSNTSSADHAGLIQMRGDEVFIWDYTTGEEYPVKNIREIKQVLRDIG